MDWSGWLPWPAPVYVVAVLLALATLLALAFARVVRQRDAEAALARKRFVLLQEVYHRAKNHLARLASMLRMQRRRVSDPIAARALDEAAGRVTVMGRLYERLQITATTDVDFADYLKHICSDTIAALAGDRIEISIDAVPLRMPSERAATAALIANELIVNAIRHGFAEDAAGRIQVDLSREGDMAVLTVVDNGRGLPAGFELAKSEGFGSRIIAALAASLDARLGVSRDDGTSFVLHFPLEAPAR